MSLPFPPLLIVTDGSQARSPLDEIFDAAFAAGCRWASVRERHLPFEEQVALARRLRGIAQGYPARLTLHGAPELAVAAGVDGVHLSSGGDAAAARRLLGPQALVGISIHQPAEAARLDPAQVDYAIAGPAFETASKPGYGPALGRIAGVEAVARTTIVPIIAIGGIDPGNVAAVLAAGATGVAVMGGVMRASDPASVVRALIAALRPRSRAATS